MEIIKHEKTKSTGRDGEKAVGEKEIKTRRDGDTDAESRRKERRLVLGDWETKQRRKGDWRPFRGAGRLQYGCPPMGG